MMHFEGDRELPQAPATVWQMLSDARFLVQCVPDVESVSAAQADWADCTIRPGFAFVRGSLKLTMHVAEAAPEDRIRLLLQTKGIGSSSDVEASLGLTAQEGGTHVHWTVDIQNVGGLLKAVPQGLMKAAAQKVIADVWSSVDARMRNP
jgi:carbon monoxide dehydrogenase subunit G